jgi:hypothetical protein
MTLLSHDIEKHFIAKFVYRVLGGDAGHLKLGGGEETGVEQFHH